MRSGGGRVDLRGLEPENMRVVSSFEIESDAVEPFLKNGYILSCPASGNAIYIDPGDEAPRLLARVRERRLSLIAVVLTHAHVDHITGVGQVVEEWGTPIYLHPEDRSIYDNLPEWGYWFGLTCDPAPPPTDTLEDGQTLSLDCLQIRVHHTPGHSPGSVSLEVENHLFCGDTVFQGSIGRTDLPAASYDVLIETIRNRILPLGDDIVLYPGHGPVTTVGEERLYNPFLTGAARPVGF